MINRMCRCNVVMSQRPSVVSQLLFLLFCPSLKIRAEKEEDEEEVSETLQKHGVCVCVCVRVFPTAIAANLL